MIAVESAFYRQRLLHERRSDSTSAGTTLQSAPEGRVDASDYLPDCLKGIDYDQAFIPKLARDAAVLREIEQAIGQIPTSHALYNTDSRTVRPEANSVHLAVTSRPYWTLKRYNDGDGQLGHVSDYDTFLAELDIVWQNVYDALAPGGRLVCVVGDVCLSRRKNNGVHTVVPLHASIQEHCRTMGYTNLAPIIWHKIANASYEAGGGGFLGKPYEPNAVVKNDIEFILMERKPGGYRKPDTATRLLSVIPADSYQEWFRQIWVGLTGASTRKHPAPYPLELAERLVRMFSFVGDTVLDPFMGTGTTSLAAARSGRNSIGIELDSQYFDMASKRLDAYRAELFTSIEITQHR